MAASWLEELLRRRILLVTGKGGTGKSSCAAGLALAAARRGLRTLLIEVECSSTARSIFHIKKPSMSPKRTSSGVEVASIEFQKGVEELIHEVMGVPRVVRVMLRHPVVTRFLRASPSVLDFVTLFQTTRFMAPAGGGSGYDLVVVDLPAFGHAKTMLNVGRTARELFKVGPLATRGAYIDDLLHNEEISSVVVVTLPEEMPVTETLEGCAALKEQELPLGPVLMNCVQPRRLSEEEEHLVEELALKAREAKDTKGADALHRSAQWSRWAQARHERTVELREQLDPAQPLIAVPLFPGAVAGMGLIDRVSRALERAEPFVDSESPGASD